MRNIGKKFAKILVSNYSLEEKIESLRYLEWFQENFVLNHKVNNYIFSPSVFMQHKFDFINKISKYYDSNIHEESHNTIITLIRNNKLKALSYVISCIKDLILRDKNLTNVKIYFAHKPTDEQLLNVESILTKDYNINPSSNVIIDKSIVAGFIAVFDGTMLDASMQEEFKEIGRIKFE